MRHGTYKPRPGARIDRSSRFGRDLLFDIVVNEVSGVGVWDYARKIMGGPFSPPVFTASADGAVNTVKVTGFNESYYSGGWLVPLTSVNGNTGRKHIGSITLATPNVLNLDTSFAGITKAGDTFRMQPVEYKRSMPKPEHGWHWGPADPTIDFTPSDGTVQTAVDTLVFGNNRPELFQNPLSYLGGGVTWMGWFRPGDSTQRLMYFPDSDGSDCWGMHPFSVGGSTCAITSKKADGTNATSDSGVNRFTYEASKWVWVLVRYFPYKSVGRAEVWANQLAGVQVNYPVKQFSFTDANIDKSFGANSSTTGITAPSSPLSLAENGHFWYGSGWKLNPSAANAITVCPAEFAGHRGYSRCFSDQEIYDVFAAPWQHFERPRRVLYPAAASGPTRTNRTDMGSGTGRTDMGSGGLRTDIGSGVVRTDI